MIRAAVASAALLFSAALPAAAATPNVVVLTGPVAADRTINDAIVIVAGPVTIRPDAHLTLQRVTTVAVADAGLIVDGALTMDDVDATSVPLQVRGDADLTAVRFGATGGDAIGVTGGTLHASNVTITAPGGAGIRATDATVAATGVTVTSAGGYGISLTRTAATMDRLTVESPADYGFLARESHVQLREATFGGHCGAYLADGSTGWVKDSTFRTIDRGLTLFTAGAVALDRLTFNGTSVGLSAFSSPLDARAIDVQDAVQGIVAVSSPGTITGGRLAADTAVEIDGNGTAIPVFRTLDLAGSTVGVRNRTATTVDARWNWWGGPPQPAAIVGPATVDPWLTQSP